MQAYRWVIDSRDEFTEERLEMLGGDMKLGECYQIGLCSLTCPKGLNPRAALKHLKDDECDVYSGQVVSTKMKQAYMQDQTIYQQHNSRSH